ncbi:uncharacterized protein LOC109710844 [Ananas comosus]|uniref:Uncharacterized protein LOC109710844 n=1 Tax=Ananas comosus TaxID=4615 RepID=A0A6P5F6V3_ANACO|nr:uncharacterized protein LOC109710844 [Ananas comosus]
MEINNNNNNNSNNKKLIWDCGSSLYDSFELDSFKRRLDSAIASRSLSMPHHVISAAPPPRPPASPKTHRLLKLPKLLHRALRRVLGVRTGRVDGEPSSVRPYDRTLFDEGVRLASIPEASEKGSPELLSSSAARRTLSEQFATLEMVL